MPKYDIEKFENPLMPNQPAGVPERKVYWRSNKHVHNAAMITAIKQWLGTTFPPPAPHVGGWDVRANSYRSNQSSPPDDDTAVEYGG